MRRSLNCSTLRTVRTRRRTPPSTWRRSRRLATKAAFDAMKYDLYTPGVVKTPAEAKALADKIVELSGQVRHSFLSVITESATQLAQDATSSLSAVPSVSAMPSVSA